MSRYLRMRLTGDEAQLGRVRAGDVARLLLGVERAVARSAGHIIGQQVKPTGRWNASVEAAARFRLVALEPGSVVGVLELPQAEATPNTFDLDDASLPEIALERVLDAIAWGDSSTPPDVARVLADMADQVGIGSRYDAVTFTVQDGQPGRPVVLGPSERDHLREISRSAGPNLVADSVLGTLVEADFEKMTARLRTPASTRVDVDFPPELADEIQQALRAPAALVGEVEYDRGRSRALRVHLRDIARGQQLAIGLELGDFWSEATIEQLASQQSVEPIGDVSVLHDSEATADEIDALMAAIEG